MQHIYQKLFHPRKLVSTGVFMLLTISITLPAHAYTMWGFSSMFPEFPDDTDVDVYIDSTSFNNNCGWYASSSQRRSIEISVERAIHRWQTSVGMPITMNFKGWASNGTRPSCPTAGCPSSGQCVNVDQYELYITCVENKSGGSAVLAEAHSYVPTCEDPSERWIMDRGEITFFKKHNNVNLPWTFGHPTSEDSYDFYTVLLHEMGHILGLSHCCESFTCGSLSSEEREICERQVMYYSLTGAWPWNRTGPHTPEIEAMRDIAWLDSIRDDMRTYECYSLNGSSWSCGYYMGNLAFHTPAVATGPDFGDVSIAFARSNDQQIEWIEGDGIYFNQQYKYFGDYSNHQPALAIDGQEIMVAWVSKDFDDSTGAGREIRVRHSTDGGNNWYTRTDIVANTSSRIDAAVTQSGAFQVWQIAWVDATTFKTKIAMSVNNGSTWYTATLDLKILDGPDLACNGSNTCQVAYREANTSMSNWPRFMSMHYYITVLIYLPLLYVDSGGPVAVSSSYNGGMAAREFTQSVSGTSSFDYHVNTGYGTYNNTTRAWRKSQSASQYPNQFSFVGSVVQTPFDVFNATQAAHYFYPSYYNVIMGYFTRPQ